MAAGLWATAFLRGAALALLAGSRPWVQASEVNEPASLESLSHGRSLKASDEDEPASLEHLIHGRRTDEPALLVDEFTLLEELSHGHGAEADAHAAADEHSGGHEGGHSAAAEHGSEEHGAKEPGAKEHGSDDEGGEEHGGEEDGAEDAGHHDAPAAHPFMHGAQGAHRAHAPGHHMEASDIGTTTAVMLLGFVAFIMALFYLVNWFDMDIRLYTWTIVSATVSIFCAVLVFSAMADTMKWILGDNSFTHFVLFVMMWAATQFLLLYFKDDNAALMRGETEEQRTDANVEDSSRSSPQSTRYDTEEGKRLLKASQTEDPKGAETDLPNIPLKAFGTIFAHITGFAAIQCFGSAQVNRNYMFTSSWLVLGLLMIVLFGGVSLAFGIMSMKVRVWWVRRKGLKEGLKQEQWREQCRESEDDAVGLCLSSLVCAVSRFSITGDIPQPHGSIHGRTPPQVVALFGFGAVFVVLVSLATFKFNRLKQEENNHRDQAPKEPTGKIIEPVRCMRIVQVFCGLTMSWCFYFATQWAFYQFLQHRKSLQGVAGKLMMAVLVSFCSMLVIFVLDCLGDGSDSCKKAIEGVIVALGLLVGISWEGTFDHAVREIGMGFSERHALLLKNMLAISLVVVVVPAWRLYIVPRTEPEVMEYFQGKLPPLTALCRTWDPTKDYQESKREKHAREKRKASHLKAAGITMVAAQRAQSGGHRPPEV